ncbi:nitroreductase/quinone reductase family protein [Pseudonocardia sp. TRM90224]|uniref:nitroreductase/quinone reductase family protein n=1 Tax=Pseudonocardia sp. TRM90224 TaxID=2812678 RepID=UPI001E2FEA75|nr:nitroreductase/quinone reductase family protein [Pseudonocardia sp. TRM90224]
MPIDFNQQVIEEFRANEGRVGGNFEGARLLLLTTTGARSGARHTVPLGYLPDGPGRVLVLGTAGGSPRHPAWFHNVKVNPDVTVEAGVFTYDARAVVLDPAARDRAFARAVDDDRGWGDYQSGVTRTIPVVALEEVAAGPPNIANARSMGEALQMIHNGFRHELALIRKEVAGAGAGLGAQLRLNCLSLCAGLHSHHEGEEAGMLPALAHRYPELAPEIERLHAEHATVAARVADLQEAIAENDPLTVRTEVDRLIDELEAHLAYEEEILLPLL